VESSETVAERDAHHFAGREGIVDSTRQIPEDSEKSIREEIEEMEKERAA
jgi:hypothetical protein